MTPVVAAANTAPKLATLIGNVQFTTGAALTEPVNSSPLSLPALPERTLCAGASVYPDGPVELCIGHVGASQLRSREVSPGEICGSDLGGREIRAREVRPGQIGATQVRVGQAGIREVCSGQVRAVEVRAPEIRPGQVRVRQIGAV